MKKTGSAKREGIDRKKRLTELHSDLLDLHKSMRKEMLNKWKRILPFDELLFDRWDKSKFMQAGENSSVYHMNYVYGDVKIGKNTWIGPFTMLDGSGGTLQIGDFCSISTGVHMYTHNTVKWSLSGGKASKQTGVVEVGDACYLGPYSLVTAGVRIGSNSLIGAFTMVNKSVPSNSIVFGVPGKVVGTVRVSGDQVEFDYDHVS